SRTARPIRSHRGRDKEEDLRDDLLGQFHLENAEGICNAHGQASLRVTAHQLQTYPQGGLLANQATTATCHQLITCATAERRLRPYDSSRFAELWDREMSEDRGRENACHVLKGRG